MSESMRSTRILGALVVGLQLGVLLCSSIAFGQNATGSISGIVIDPSGAVIPKASVVLTDEARRCPTIMDSSVSRLFRRPLTP
jgi:hypothetical protein